MCFFFFFFAVICQHLKGILGENILQIVFSAFVLPCWLRGNGGNHSDVWAAKQEGEIRHLFCTNQQLTHNMLTIFYHLMKRLVLHINNLHFCGFMNFYIWINEKRHNNYCNINDNHCVVDMLLEGFVIFGQNHICASCFWSCTEQTGCTFIFTSQTREFWEYFPLTLSKKTTTAYFHKSWSTDSGRNIQAE